MRSSAFPTALVIAATAALALPAGAAGQPPTRTKPAASITLIDVTTESGVAFRHFNGMTGKLYYPEVVGAGGALLDYDQDGDLDLYLVQGAQLGSLDPSRAIFPWTSPEPPRDQLFRNDSTAGELRFTNVTRASKLDAGSYGMGAAVGDVDNDGWPDLLVLNWGANELWRNRGDGTFEDVTGEWNAGDPRFSVSASFSDFDGDGHLDLYVVNYLEYDLAINKSCLTERGEKDYCLPSAYRPQTDALMLQREGTFIDLGATVGLGVAANGLGVLAADLDENGRLDVYVANDLMANHLLLQQAPGADGSIRFVDDALLFGAALNGAGRPEASMGVDAGDVDGDGDLDVFLTHFRRESNTLYRMSDKGFFEDASDSTGVAAPSWAHTAFGTRFVDLDLDGDLDLFIANGGVTFPPGVDRTENPYPLGEPNQVLRNDGGRFVDVTGDLPPASGLRLSQVSRAVLSGDLDNDGDLDLVVTNNSGTAQVVRNDAPPNGQQAWVGIDLRLGPAQGSRPAFGATLRTTGNPSDAVPRKVRVHNDGGYAGASDWRVIQRRNGAEDAARFTVTWPDGTAERFELPWSNAYRRVTPGSGEPVRQTSTSPGDGR